MAFVAVTIAVCAIIATALIAAIAVSRLFSSYTKYELQTAAQTEAYRISDLMNYRGVDIYHAVPSDLALKFLQNTGDSNGQTWVIDGNGNPVSAIDTSELGLGTT